MMALQAVVIVLLSCLLASSQAATRYQRVARYDEEIVVKCNKIERERFHGLLGLDGVDVWKITPDGSADIRMKKELYRELKGDYPECFILHSSVEQLVREAEILMKPQNTTAKAEWFEEYHTYSEIIDWYKELAEKYPLVEYVESIGKSFQGRDMPAVRIDAVDGSEVSYKLYIQCQIHAREWVSGATCMYLVNYLVEEFENNNDRVVELLKRVEFVFVPLVNPDGYEYTWTNERLWRKNLRPGPTCDGVDLNRNYPDHWEWTNGSSPNPCAETYRGASAASEPETQNVISYFHSLQSAERPVIGAMDWHSFSQLILRPFGWTYDPVPDEGQLGALGAKMSNTIFGVHGKTYTSQRAVDLYPGTGTALDWFYSEEGNSENNGYRAASMVYELRDTGTYGFLLPPDQIVPNGEEIVPSVLDFAENLANDPLKF